MSAVTTLTHDQILSEFHSRGYVILPGLIETDVVAAVIADLESWVDTRARELLDSGRITHLCEEQPFEYRLACLHRQSSHESIVASTLRQELHWPGMFRLFFHTKVLDIVESILGPEIRLYPNYSIRPKLPQHAPTKVLWHQDAGYTESGRHGNDPNAVDTTVEGLRMVNVWSPLVPARVANGCMKFVPGSHTLGVVAHEEREHYLEITQQVLEPMLPNAVDIECDPGDVILFSNMLFHMGGDNMTDMVRWSADWRYQDATQSTMRAERGHLARSRQHPDQVVASADHWAQLSFV